MAGDGPPSDESLMARYQRRLDEEAFHELVERFLPPAHAVARQLLPSRSLAEDAVQEAFLRLVRRSERYDSSRPFAPWFYTILRNVCTDMLRRRGRRQHAIEQASVAQEWRQPGPPSSVDAFGLLGRLSADDQAVLKLRVVHDLPFRDVAAALGISEEAAKKRGQRALRRLRQLAREEGHLPAASRTALDVSGADSSPEPVPAEAARTY